MGFDRRATDFILPLSVSLFRIGTVMANPIKLVFLAHVYGIALRPEIDRRCSSLTEVVFSLSAAGIPNSGGAGRRLPHDPRVRRGGNPRRRGPHARCGRNHSGHLRDPGQCHGSDERGDHRSRAARSTRRSSRSRRLRPPRSLRDLLCAAGASRFTMDEFFSFEEPALVDRFRVIDFEQLPAMRRFERGTYVIAGIDQAAPAMRGAHREPMRPTRCRRRISHSQLAQTHAGPF